MKDAKDRHGFQMTILRNLLLNFTRSTGRNELPSAGLPLNFWQVRKEIKIFQIVSFSLVFFFF